jgi:hypothetical protein
MKRLACVMVFVLLTFCFAFTSEAGVWSANYPYSPDDGVVYDRYSWDWWNHLAITWNDTQITVSAIQMDPDGIPNVYYWGDIYSGSYPYATYMYLYYSSDGYNWYYAGTYYYY